MRILVQKGARHNDGDDGDDGDDADDVCMHWLKNMVQISKDAQLFLSSFEAFFI